MQTSTFYDRYHLQNRGAKRVIRDGDFTYFYLTRILRKACKLTRKKKSLHILDVGCGVGSLSLWLANQGHKVVGVDIAPSAIEMARTAALAANIKSTSFVEGELIKGKPYFDLVLCSEVIEHIEDDRAFIKILTSHLKPNGILVLTTPSSENALAKLGFYQEFDQRVGHYRRYTASGLRQLLERSGFEILEINKVEGPLRNILFISPLGFLIRLIRGPLVPIFHILDEFFSKIMGAADLQILARKK